jgi:hypothetical protein
LDVQWQTVSYIRIHNEIMTSLPPDVTIFYAAHFSVKKKVANRTGVVKDVAGKARKVSNQLAQIA